MEFKIPEPIEASEGWIILELIVDVLFWVDLLFNFLFTYHDAHGREVFNLLKIAKRYLRTTFVINLIGCFPPQAVGWFLMLVAREDTHDQSMNKAFHLVRLQKVVRFLQFLRLVRILRAFPYAVQSVIFRRIGKGTRVMNFIVMLLWVVHLIACGWYLVAVLHSDPQDTWIKRRQINAQGLTLYEAGPVEQWMHAMYFVLAVFTTVGFGDIAAATSGEVAYAFVTMLIGIVINSIIVGKLVNVVTRLDQQDIDVGKQKDLVEAFAEHTLLCPRRADELLASLNTARAGRRGFDRDQVRTLLNGSHLPRQVMGQLPRDVFGGRLLQNRIIRDLHSRVEMPSRLPLLIAVAVHQRFVFSKEVVYYCYDHPESLFLVLEGTFANVAKPDRLGGLSELQPSMERLFRISEQYGTGVGSASNQGALYPYQLFSAGSYFGEAELLLEPSPRRSCTRCESESGGLLLALHKDDLSDIVKEFPRFATAWRDAALRREVYRRALLKRLTFGRSFRHFAAASIQKFFKQKIESQHGSSSAWRGSLRLVNPVPSSSSGRLSTKPMTANHSQPATQGDLNKLRQSIVEMQTLLIQLNGNVMTHRGSRSSDSRHRVFPPGDTVNTPPLELSLHATSRQIEIGHMGLPRVSGRCDGIRGMEYPTDTELPGRTGCDEPPPGPTSVH
jgi:CRP-like cAMP-binding protein